MFFEFQPRIHIEQANSSGHARQEARKQESLSRSPRGEKRPLSRVGGLLYEALRRTDFSSNHEGAANRRAALGMPRKTPRKVEALSRFVRRAKELLEASRVVAGTS